MQIDQFQLSRRRSQEVRILLVRLNVQNFKLNLLGVLDMSCLQMNREPQLSKNRHGYLIFFTRIKRYVYENLPKIVVKTE